MHCCFITKTTRRTDARKKKRKSCCNTDIKKHTHTHNQATRDSVQEYYGKILTKSDDLKTNACTTDANMPDSVKAVMPLLNDEVILKYYGCGIVMPEELEGCNVLDLGCGAGRDCYIISKLVGPKGKVVGVDMTDEQLEVANRHVDFHTKSFGYDEPNVEFKKGYIEKLADLGLPDNYFDVIVSNCVINLSPDKDAVLREAYRVLKPGGELYFSDVYSDRRVPQELVDDPVLFGECLSGALYWNDFLTVARRHGFNDPRLVSDSRITVSNKKIEKRVSCRGACACACACPARGYGFWLCLWLVLTLVSLAWLLLRAVVAGLDSTGVCFCFVGWMQSMKTRALVAHKKAWC